MKNEMPTTIKTTATTSSMVGGKRERTRGKANYLALVRNYPGGVGTVEPKSARLVGAEDRWVLTPMFTQLRIEGSGERFTPDAG